MLYVRNLIAICVFFVLLQDSNTQEGNFCRTPSRDAGVCVNIRDCANLVNLLRTQSNNPDVRNYLVRSTCGYQGTTPMVCCPQNAATTSRRPTEPPVTDPPTQPPTSPPVSSTETSNGGDNEAVVRTLMGPPHCGVNTMSVSRIVGGVDAQLGDFPWITALGYKNSKNPDQPKWLCGGSLITDMHVLTAAHCVYNRQDLYLARLGELDLYSDEDGANPVNIPLAKAKIHEDYSPTSYTNDIAILTLAYKPTHGGVWPVCLPIVDPVRSKNFDNFLLYVAGWGSIYFNGPSSAILQKVQLPIWNENTCRNAFSAIKSTVIDDRVICAGEKLGGQDACQGDSGGPLMYGKPGKRNITMYLIGVVSYGFKCAQPGYAGVYTRVSSFMDWIENNIN